MAIDLVTFRIIVRRTAGAPGACEIDDATIDAKITEAAKKLGRLNPRRVAEPVAFGANDPNAEFPADCFGVDHTYEIVEDAGLDGASFGNSGYSNLTGYGESSFTGSLMNTVQGLSDVRMLQHVGEMSQRTFPAMEFQERGGYIHVRPPPTSAETFYVPLLKAHTLASFPAPLEDQLADLAAGLVYYVRAGKFKIEEMSAAGGRQKIKLGKIRDFCKGEGDRLVGAVASMYGLTLSELS